MPPSCVPFSLQTPEADPCLGADACGSRGSGRGTPGPTRRGGPVRRERAVRLRRTACDSLLRRSSRARRGRRTPGALVGDGLLGSTAFCETSPSDIGGLGRTAGPKSYIECEVCNSGQGSDRARTVDEHARLLVARARELERVGVSAEPTPDVRDREVGGVERGDGAHERPGDAWRGTTHADILRHKLQRLRAGFVPEVRLVTVCYEAAPDRRQPRGPLLAGVTLQQTVTKPDSPARRTLRTPR